MRDSLKAATLSSLAWKLLERGGNQVIQLVVQIVMARLLSPEQFGALAIMLVFIAVGNIIVQSGLNTAIIQAQEIDEVDLSTVFWLSFSASLALFVVIFLSAPTIALFYAMPDIVWPLRALGFLLLISAFNSVQVAIVQRSLRLKKVFSATMAAVFASGVSGISSAYVGFGLWALVIQQLIYQIVSCVVLSVQVRWFPRFVFDFDRAKKHYAFSWKLLASNLLEQGYSSLAELIIGKQFSAASLGLLSQGKKYPMALGAMIDGAIQPVMLAVVSRVQDNAADVRRLVRRALKISTFLVIPSMVFFAVCATPIVQLLLGEKWLPCVPFLQMYCIVYAMRPIHTTNLQVLNGMGRSDLFLRLELIKKTYEVILILLAAFIFQNVYLMVGLYVLADVISIFVNAWPNRKIINYSCSEQLRDIAPAFVLSILSGMLTSLFCSFIASDALQIIGGLIVMCASYLGLAKLLGNESFEYLSTTFKEILDTRRARVE